MNLNLSLLLLLLCIVVVFVVVVVVVVSQCISQQSESLETQYELQQAEEQEDELWQEVKATITFKKVGRRKFNLMFYIRFDITEYVYAQKNFPDRNVGDFW